MNNPNKKIFEYCEPRTAEHYNGFFNPNVCHVCKSVDKGNLILCDQCCLISYCSEEHKKMHYPYHEKSCEIIAQILQVRPHQDTRKFNDWQEWIKSREILMELIQKRLDDKMEPYMQQMILWSKSCYICHQQAELRVCQRCFSANYCDEHATIFHATHDGGNCDRLMLLFNIDIETISGNTSNISYGFLRFVNETSCFEEMLEFCMDYILVRRKNLDWLVRDYVRSDYLSGPLTVYSGYKRSSMFYILQKEHVVIHIIAENFVKRNSLEAWEILLHLIPKIRKLLIVIIGSELMYDSHKRRLCKCCTDKQKEFSYFSIPMLYHDFVKSSERYTIPNVILIFHAELKTDICAAFIRKIADQGCPLFLSTTSARKATRNMIQIQKILAMEIGPDFVGRNYFSGLAPHKDLETGDTYFCNEYLIIYNHLDDESDKGSDTSNPHN